jgi:acyl-CoA thioesterase-1
LNEPVVPGSEPAATRRVTATKNDLRHTIDLQAMTIANDPGAPFWRSGQIAGDALLFIEPAPGEPATAMLLMPPNRPVTLTSATGDVVYAEHTDYTVDRFSGRVTRTPGSRIAVTTAADLSPAADPDGTGFMHVRGSPNSFLMVDQGDLFHRRQAAASYAFDAARWTGYRPAYAGARVPRTVERFERRESVTLCVLGDSISEGYSASGFIGAPPRQPPYATLVAASLERIYGSPIALRNFAEAGSTSDDGLHTAAAAAAEGPNLVIVAYGMNDAGYADAGSYAANIRAIIETIANDAPRAEFVLVSPMLPHPDWHYPQTARFAGYRQALDNLCRPGVILADMTRLWTDVLERKSPYDLTGNGINHPNDFGHRLYAQTILSLLAE